MCHNGNWNGKELTRNRRCKCTFNFWFNNHEIFVYCPKVGQSLAFFFFGSHSFSFWLLLLFLFLVSFVSEWMCVCVSVCICVYQYFYECVCIFNHWKLSRLFNNIIAISTRISSFLHYLQTFEKKEQTRMKYTHSSHIQVVDDIHLYTGNDESFATFIISILSFAWTISFSLQIWVYLKMDFCIVFSPVHNYFSIWFGHRV